MTVARAVSMAMLSLCSQASVAQSVTAKAGNGAMLFHRYCATCHGETARGDGVAAKLFDPRPPDLTRSKLSEEYKESIIRLGGREVGRSPGMPPWRDELDDEQIRDLLGYLRSVKAAR